MRHIAFSALILAMFAGASAVAAEPLNSRNLCFKTRETLVYLADTAITNAAKTGDIKVLKEAFKAGVSPNATTYEGFSLLHIAITEHQDAVIELLIQHGVDLNQPFMGTSPLALVSQTSGGDQADVKREQLVAKAGGKLSDFDVASATVRRLGYRNFAAGFIDAITKGDMVRLDLYARATYDINEPLSDGISPLHVAAIQGTPDAVRFLVRCGANVNARTKRGTPVLWFAKDRPEIAELLRALGSSEKN
ncbi:MAG: ankyrin repeat domain-containing protein [Microcystis sp. M015S1]|jgi:ankyrin repeat protein|uniref:ankyrin repeat domain-containing protein n=1 Tax=Microcystis sp. M017S1 TaxID=2771107 RepID=UPI002587F6DE|nr:ankyrin repeat domain-containing protein [Microcystis sp. M017S1]MCA2917208.1 ankyrin repeat domain-containing protein [Microcystis sp. M017S1]MCA2936506.1 ankyrin repeat domain-containing protein [Microcystis sp. M015S1]MCA3173710.1 ankyrin repeat domain-containing protein [Burkholderiales bacterium]